MIGVLCLSISEQQFAADCLFSVSTTACFAVASDVRVLFICPSVYFRIKLFFINLLNDSHCVMRQSMSLTYSNDTFASRYLSDKASDQLHNVFLHDLNCSLYCSCSFFYLK